MPYIFAVSGMKNSGKTTYICKLVAALKGRGYDVGVIKHDGHDLIADAPGTDTYRHRQSGADKVIVFSDTKYVYMNYSPPQAKALFDKMSDMDFIILEGFKFSGYPKIEIVRKGNASLCAAETLIAIATDDPGLEAGALDLNDIDSAISIILERFEKFNNA